MEPQEPTTALADELTVHQAQGVLAALLDIPIHDAATSLELKAQFRGMTLKDTARAVLDDHERRISVAAPPRDLDDRALAILRQHLDRATSPLDEQAHADPPADVIEDRKPTVA